MSPQEIHQARRKRQNTVSSTTALITFTALVIASVFDFRDDVELLVALQGALTAAAHRVAA